MDKECRHCVFFDQCGSKEACEYYAPIGDEYNDDNIGSIIEARRMEFRDEWFKYIEENED